MYKVYPREKGAQRVSKKSNKAVLIYHKFANDPIEIGVKSDTVSKWRYIITIRVYKTVKKSVFQLVNV